MERPCGPNNSIIRIQTQAWKDFICQTKHYQRMSQRITNIIRDRYHIDRFHGTSRFTFWGKLMQDLLLQAIVDMSAVFWTVAVGPGLRDQAASRDCCHPVHVWLGDRWGPGTGEFRKWQQQPVLQAVLVMYFDQAVLVLNKWHQLLDLHRPQYMRTFCKVWGAECWTSSFDFYRLPMTSRSSVMHWTDSRSSKTRSSVCWEMSRCDDSEVWKTLS